MNSTPLPFQPEPQSMKVMVIEQEFYLLPAHIDPGSSSEASKLLASNSKSGGLKIYRAAALQLGALDFFNDIIWLSS
jgi:hypothetical protein